MRKIKAFTLVELLVVIGVIALLIAILMPALSKAKQQATKLACAANLRSMGQALTMYTGDYKYYPGHAARAANGKIIAVWPSRLRATLKAGRGAFWCPSNPEGFQWQSAKSPTGTGGGQYATQADTVWGYEVGEMLLDVATVPFSYGYNDWGLYELQNPQRGLGGDLFNTTYKEVRSSAVKRAAEMIAVADGTPDGSWDFNIDPLDKPEWPGKIHGGGANVLFCDGHVDWYKQSDLVRVDSTPTGRRMARMWNNNNEP